MTKTEKAVLQAAMGCVNPQGFSFTYARENVNLYVIDRAKFQRLEKAVATHREARKRRPGGSR